jgi:FkbM family methyltransferase
MKSENKYFSQYQQDKFLNEVIFANKKDGFFIDIGAHDGVLISNSLFFEKYKNWGGICIEPNPTVYHQLVTNRKSDNLNVCIGNEKRKVKFTQIEGYSEMLSGVTEKYDKQHLERINKDLLAKGGTKNEIEVDMIPLGSIENLKNQKIDFISIDTEGNEFDIVRGIDFNLMDIKALVVENNYKDYRVKDYLKKFGFKLIYQLDCDEVFVNKCYLSLMIEIRILIWKSKLFWKRITKKWDLQTVNVDFWR